MKLQLFLFAFLSVALSGPVKRDADADPDADPGFAPGNYATEPVCNSVPTRHCQPRQVETPRKECHHEYDTIVDTVVTEHCEEVITTSCHQTSQATRHHSAVVGQDSRVVATHASGVVTHAHGPSVATGPVAPVASVHGAVAHHHGKRDADPQPDADADPAADADADADPGHYREGPVVASAPVCNSVPMRQCKQVPVEQPRKVARLICKVVADVTTIEDCEDIITTHCQQRSKQVTHSSAVVGQTTKLVEPPHIVATGPVALAAGHDAAPVAVAAGPVAVAAGHAGPVAVAAGHAGPVAVAGHPAAVVAGHGLGHHG